MFANVTLRRDFLVCVCRRSFCDRLQTAARTASRSVEQFPARNVGRTRRVAFHCWHTAEVAFVIDHTRAQ